MDQINQLGKKFPASSYYEKLGKYSIPLYARSTRGDYSVRGSSFIIKIEEDYYLVTAKHVFDQNRTPGGVFISSAPGEFYLAKGNQIHTGKKLIIEKNDLADISIVHLASEIPKPPYRFIYEGENIANFDAIDKHVSSVNIFPHTDLYYAALGYPLSKNKINHARRYIQHNLYCYRDFSPGSDEYKKLGLDENKNILIKFDREQASLTPNQKILFPDPVGMSGGPIFQLFKNQNNPKDFYFSIAGIVTSQDPMKKFLQGTAISRVFNLIHILRSK